MPTIGSINVLSVNDWIVFQQRVDGTLSFNRGWAEYRNGFGTYNTNFWMGLEKLHQLTRSGKYMLRLEVFTQAGKWLSDEYDTFSIESEPAKYKINMGTCYGDGGNGMNALTYPNGRVNGRPFTTLEQGGCAASWQGGWWYENCFNINLNGAYGSSFSISSIGTKLTTSRMMMKQIN